MGQSTNSAPSVQTAATPARDFREPKAPPWRRTLDGYRSDNLEIVKSSAFKAKWTVRHYPSGLGTRIEGKLNDCKQCVADLRARFGADLWIFDRIGANICSAADDGPLTNIKEFIRDWQPAPKPKPSPKSVAPVPAEPDPAPPPSRDFREEPTPIPPPTEPKSRAPRRRKDELSRAETARFERLFVGLMVQVGARRSSDAAHDVFSYILDTPHGPMSISIWTESTSCAFFLKFLDVEQAKGMIRSLGGALQCGKVYSGKVNLHCGKCDPADAIDELIRSRLVLIGVMVREEDPASIPPPISGGAPTSEREFLAAWHADFDPPGWKNPKPLMGGAPVDLMADTVVATVDPLPGFSGDEPAPEPVPIQDGPGNVPGCPRTAPRQWHDVPVLPIDRDAAEGPWVPFDDHDPDRSFGNATSLAELAEFEARRYDGWHTQAGDMFARTLRALGDVFG